MSIGTHLYGQDLAARLLDAAARQPVQAYLLVGPERTGKSLAARLFVQALNCAFRERPRGADSDPEPPSAVRPPPSAVPCGHCEPCRAIAGGYFPDRHCWSPDPARKRRTIKIDQIRQLERLSIQHPLSAVYQVLQVNEAQAMELEAAQCFLKTLEEPAPHTIHLLLATGTLGMLPTVLSRCQIIPFHLLPASIIAPVLEERLAVLASRAGELSSAAQGRIGWAIARARDEEPAPPQLDGLEEWPEGRLDATRLAEKWVGRSPEDIIAGLQEFQRLLYAKMVQRGALSRSVLAALQLCEEAIGNLNYFVSPKLVLEVTFARLARVAPEIKQ